MVLDMPLSQLQGYMGINPKPADFDSFWKDSVEEIHAVDANVQLIPSEFQAPGVVCMDLFYTGTHGARIHCNFARPEKICGSHPALMVFHGYTGSASDFVALLPYAHAGFFSASMDVRGQGGLSEDVGSRKGPTIYGHIVNGLLEEDMRNLFFRNVFLDTVKLAEVLGGMEGVDAKRMACMGGSQGGGLSLACAALVPELAIAVSQFPWLSDYQRVWEMDLDKDAYQGLKDFFRHFDPTHEREAEIFEKLGYIDVHHLASKIQAKVLMATGLLDNICPPSTQFAAYNHIMSEKEMVLYPDFGHEYMPGFEMKAYQLLMTLR